MHAWGVSEFGVSQRRRQLLRPSLTSIIEMETLMPSYGP